MKIDIKSIIIVAGAFLLYQHFFSVPDETVEDVTVSTEEKVGEVADKVVEVARDTIFIEVPVPGKVQPVKKEIVVDSIYKKEYEKAIKDNDSLRAKNLFLESIALDTYSGTLVDNDDIKIDGLFETRGKLLSYDIDYVIKKDSVTYTPEIVPMYPKLTITGGLEVGVQTNPLRDGAPFVSGKVGFMNKKGNTLSLGYDTEQRVTVGYSIVLFKTKR